MDARLVYTTLVGNKHTNYAALERELKLSNGSIGLAVRRGSRIKPKTVDKLLKLYPDLNKTWIQTGEGSPFIGTDNTHTVQEPAPVYNAADPEKALIYKALAATEETKEVMAKYIGLLEKNAAKGTEALEKALSIHSSEIKELYVEVLGMQRWTLKHLADLQGGSARELQKDLRGVVDQIHNKGLHLEDKKKNSGN